MTTIGFHFTSESNIPELSKKPCWLCIFSQPLLGNTYYKHSASFGSSDPLAIPLTITAKQPRTSMFIACFLYTMEQSEAKQEYVARVGFAQLTLGDAEAGNAQPLLDINNNDIGTVRFTLRVDPKTGNALDAPAGFTVYDDSDEVKIPSMSGIALYELRQDAEKQLRALDKEWSGQTQVPDALAHYVFLTVPQHCGDVPIWAFTALNMRTDAKPSEKYFEQALYNVKYLMMVEDIDFDDEKLVGEMLSEICTLPVRAQLYVVDRTENGILVDDWINPLLSPVQNLVGLDCEDATQRILQEGCWLSQWETSKNKELALLARINKNRYISFLACMTLKLPDGRWTYHAAALKLDRRFVLSALGLRGPFKEEPWPAILLEGTAYTTGCWSYTSVLGSDRADAVSKASALEFSGGIESICKYTPGIMAEKSLYGPIQSLCSMDLHEFGIVQIELSEQGRRAARAESVMEYSRDVKWHAVKVDQKELAKKLEQVKFQCYPACPVPLAATKPSRPPIAVRKNARMDLLMRRRDWNQDLQREVEEEAHGKVNAVTLNLAADLDIVHVTA